MIAIILTSLTILGIFLTLFLWVLQKPVACLMTLGITMGLFLSMWVSVACTTNKPTAMDVYQGKTTLEYTIRDGEIVDSVVVFKNK